MSTLNGLQGVCLVDSNGIAAGKAGALPIGKLDHSTTGIGQGVKTVTAAGTDEALAALI